MSYFHGQVRYFSIGNCIQRTRVVDKCITETKSFRDATWKKKTFGGTVQKDEFSKKFSQAQGSWKAADNEYRSSKSKYDQVSPEQVLPVQIK